MFEVPEDSVVPPDIPGQSQPQPQSTSSELPDPFTPIPTLTSPPFSLLPANLPKADQLSSYPSHSPRSSLSSSEISSGSSNTHSGLTSPPDPSSPNTGTKGISLLSPAAGPPPGFESYKRSTSSTSTIGKGLGTSNESQTSAFKRTFPPSSAGALALDQSEGIQASAGSVLDSTSDVWPPPPSSRPSFEPTPQPQPQPQPPTPSVAGIEKFISDSYFGKSAELSTGLVESGLNGFGAAGLQRNGNNNSSGLGGGENGTRSRSQTLGATSLQSYPSIVGSSSDLQSASVVEANYFSPSSRSSGFDSHRRRNSDFGSSTASGIGTTAVSQQIQRSYFDPLPGGREDRDPHGISGLRSLTRSNSLGGTKLSPNSNTVSLASVLSSSSTTSSSSPIAPANLALDTTNPHFDTAAYPSPPPSRGLAIKALPSMPEDEPLSAQTTDPAASKRNGRSGNEMSMSRNRNQSSGRSGAMPNGSHGDGTEENHSHSGTNGIRSRNRSLSSAAVVIGSKPPTPPSETSSLSSASDAPPSLAAAAHLIESRSKSQQQHQHQQQQQIRQQREDPSNTSSSGSGSASANSALESFSSSFPSARSISSSSRAWDVPLSSSFSQNTNTNPAASSPPRSRVQPVDLASGAGQTSSTPVQQRYNLLDRYSGLLSPARSMGPALPSSPGFGWESGLDGSAASPGGYGGIGYSNMSPFTRDGTKQLAGMPSEFSGRDDGSNGVRIGRQREYSLGAVGSGRARRTDVPWSGMSGSAEAATLREVDEDDEFAPPTRSGATSRRHSVAAFSKPPDRSQLGFDAGLSASNSNASTTTGRDTSSNPFGGKPGSLALSEDDLAADLSNALQLNLDAASPSSADEGGIGSTPRSIAIGGRALPMPTPGAPSPYPDPFGMSQFTTRYDEQSGSPSAARGGRSLSLGLESSPVLGRGYTNLGGPPSPSLVRAAQRGFDIPSQGYGGATANAYPSPTQQRHLSLSGLGGFPNPLSSAAFQSPSSPLGQSGSGMFSPPLSAQAQPFNGAFGQTLAGMPGQSQHPVFFPANMPGGSATQQVPGDLSDLGKGVPLQAVPHGAPLYIVEFKAGRTDLFYIADPNLTVQRGDLVIVEADRGKDLGRILHDNISLDEVQAFQQRQVEVALGQLASPQHGEAPPNPQAIARMTKEIHPKVIFSKATATDTQLLVLKAQDEAKALQLCRSKVISMGLDMEVTDAEWQWDRRKLTFFFIADRRVDFRGLVKDLFRLYKTRIWMCSMSSIG